MIVLFISVLLSAASLSMDAFAVSICNGMIYQDIKLKKAIVVPLTFAMFQSIMPIIGFYIGLAIVGIIDSFDHWIVFALLVIIGGKMIYDSIKEMRAEDKQLEPDRKSFSYPTVLLQGVATSVDTLAIGFGLNSLLEGVVGNIQLWAWICVGMIGLITFIISFIGLIIGKKVGQRFRKKASIAQLIGGCILLLIAIKIVVEAYYRLV